MTDRLPRDEEQVPVEGEESQDTAHDDPGTHRTTEAQPDHSERAWGGDQDIDTAGQIPSEMATTPEKPPDSER